MKAIWKRHLYEFLWPNRCPCCDALIGPYRTACEPCADRMRMDPDAYCRTCGKPVCICEAADLHYDMAVAACAYAEDTVTAVLRMKQSENTNFAAYAADILAMRLKDYPGYGSFDCVMPVPMHPAKQRQRGYNQAALIAREVGELLCIPFREDALRKARTAHAQHELSAEERAKNVLSITIRPDCRLDGQRILLCDDVLTTGHTMSRCAALLKENGAATVVAAAASTTIRSHPPREGPSKEETP